MRFGSKWLFQAVAVLCFACVGGTQVAAQGFFQQLFGFGSQPSPEPLPRPQSPLTPGGRPYTMPGPSSSPRRSNDDDDDRQSKSGNLKTVCVRMCDGYFFPVSNATTKKGLFRDQMKCRSACGDEGRLFHLPAGSTDVGEATDGQGRIYGLLNVAYKYRKGLVAGCQCRPAPWSEAEVARHQQYAEAEAVKNAAEQERAAKIAAADTGDAKADAKASAVALAQPSAEPAQKPAKIAGNTRSNTASKAATQTRRAPPPQMAQAPKLAPSGVMSLGGGGLQWPGDPPKR